MISYSISIVGSQVRFHFKVEKEFQIEEFQIEHGGINNYLGLSLHGSAPPDFKILLPRDCFNLVLIFLKSVP